MTTLGSTASTLYALCLYSNYAQCVQCRNCKAHISYHDGFWNRRMRNFPLFRFFNWFLLRTIHLTAFEFFFNFLSHFLFLPVYTEITPTMTTHSTHTTSYLCSTRLTLNTHTTTALISIMIKSCHLEKKILVDLYGVVCKWLLSKVSRTHPIQSEWIPTDTSCQRRRSWRWGCGDIDPPQGSNSSWWPGNTERGWQPPCSQSE